MSFALVLLLLAGDLRLIEAVKRRDPQAVETLIRQKASLDGSDGGTALA